MQKILYIIPGYGETCRRGPYQKLRKIAERKGYAVIFKNVDWKKKLAPQMFPVEQWATLFGFSLGAVLARLIAQEYPCKSLILGSMTPLETFREGEHRKSLVKLLGRSYVDDVRKKLQPKHKAKKQIMIYGELEKCPADIIVPKTRHKINDMYLKEIEKLL